MAALLLTRRGGSGRRRTALAALRTWRVLAGVGLWSRQRRQGLQHQHAATTHRRHDSPGQQKLPASSMRGTILDAPCSERKTVHCTQITMCFPRLERRPTEHQHGIPEAFQLLFATAVGYEFLEILPTCTGKSKVIARGRERTPDCGGRKARRKSMHR